MMLNWQEKTKWASIRAEIQCFSMGEIAHAYIQDNVLTIVNITNQIYMFDMSQKQGIQSKIIKPYAEMPLGNQQYKKIKISQIDSINKTIVILALTKQHTLQIWQVASNIILIQQFPQIIDFITNKNMKAVHVIQKNIKQKEQKLQTTYIISRINIYSKIFEREGLERRIIVSTFFVTICENMKLKDNFPYFIDFQYLFHQDLLIHIQDSNWSQILLPWKIGNKECIQSVSIEGTVVIGIGYEGQSLYNLYFFDRITDKSQKICINNFFSNTGNLKVIDAKLINNTNIIAILLNSSVTQLILIVPGLYLNQQFCKVIQKLVVPYVSSPLLINNSFRQKYWQIIDTQSLCINYLYIQKLASIYTLMDNKLLDKPVISSKSKRSEEMQIHTQTNKNLNNRLNNLRTLNSYMEAYDISTSLRFLENCENIGVLNDGLLMIANKQLPFLYVQQRDNPDIWDSFHSFFRLCCKLYESKYESHIQNALRNLIILTTITSRIIVSQLSPSCKKQLKKLTELLQKVVNSKRTNKLLQQDKKRTLFQLAYQLKNLVHSYGRVIR